MDLLSIKSLVKGKCRYLPVVLVLLIYVAPLISLSVMLCSPKHTSHHSSNTEMVLTDDSHHPSKKDHHQSEPSHHQHGWCGYCELLANNSVLPLFALFMPLLMLALICRIRIFQSRIGFCFSYLFPTPRAPPIFR